LKEVGQYHLGQKAGIWKTYNEEGDEIAVDDFGEPK
jgi:hypothetical protein